MIHNETRLREVLEEIAGWDLAKRRAYIADMGKAFGPEAAEQIKQGLKELWGNRK
ncbi:MAG TPA: hypothetical protein VF534_27150 [Paraburkholderia sp.]